MRCCRIGVSYCSREWRVEQWQLINENSVSLCRIARLLWGCWRRASAIFFFCNTMVHRPLFRLKRMAPIERTLFRSPYRLRQLSFNARQVREGFYDAAEGQTPFTVESIAEFFAKTEADAFLQNQQLVLQRLIDYCPDYTQYTRHHQMFFQATLELMMFEPLVRGAGA